MSSTTGKLPCWITRCMSGRYLITFGPPVFREVGNSGECDWYAKEGDALAFREICPYATVMLFGRELEIGEVRRCKFQGEISDHAWSGQEEHDAKHKKAKTKKSKLAPAGDDPLRK